MSSGAATDPRTYRIQLVRGFFHFDAEARQHAPRIGDSQRVQCLRASGHPDPRPPGLIGDVVLAVTSLRVLQVRRIVALMLHFVALSPLLILCVSSSHPLL